MPAQLIRLRPRDFNWGVLDFFRIRLAKLWTAAQIEEVEADHRDLIKAYENEETVRRTIDRHDLKTMFNEAWDSLKDRFKTLRCFCSGLAIAFANTTSVESDFSVLKWEIDLNRTSLTNLTIEGIFQSKQHELLSQI